MIGRLLLHDKSKQEALVSTLTRHSPGGNPGNLVDSDLPSELLDAARSLSITEERLRAVIMLVTPVDEELQSDAPSAASSSRSASPKRTSPFVQPEQEGAAAPPPPEGAGSSFVPPGQQGAAAPPPRPPPTRDADAEMPDVSTEGLDGAPRADDSPGATSDTRQTSRAPPPPAGREDDAKGASTSAGGTKRPHQDVERSAVAGEMEVVSMINKNSSRLVVELIDKGLLRLGQIKVIHDKTDYSPFGVLSRSGNGIQIDVAGGYRYSTINAFVTAVQKAPGNEALAAVKLNPFRYTCGVRADHGGHQWQSLEKMRKEAQGRGV